MINYQEIFCKKYEAKVKLSDQHVDRVSRAEMYKPIGFNDDVMVRRIQLVEIKIPEDRWRAFLEKEAMMHKMFSQHSSLNNHPVDHFWDEFVNESIVREEVPSVKIAYDKYKNLLELVRRNYG